MQRTQVTDHPNCLKSLPGLLIVGLSLSLLFPTPSPAQETQSKSQPTAQYELSKVPAQVSDRQEKAEICNRLGADHHQKGEHKAAIDCFRQARRELGIEYRNSLKAAKILTNEALAQAALGQGQQARECLEEVTQIMSATRGQDFEKSIMLNAAGKVELTLGDPLKAEVLFSQALALRAKEPEARDKNAFSPLLNLGAAQLALGEFEKSRSNLVQALNLARKIWGTSSEQALAALISLVTVDQELGELQNARNELAEATEVAGQLFGPFHEKTQVLKAWQIPNNTCKTLGEERSTIKPPR